jgi:predicted heme/steroid binding protein
MAIYFDFKTINELTGDNYYRTQREFTLEELSQYTGSHGNPAYVAIEGIVYDISNYRAWSEGTHFGLIAGQDLTNQFDSCHGIIDILTNAPKVGILIHGGNMNSRYTMSMERQQDTSKFTPDDWIRYISPLVIYALREPNQGVNNQLLYQKIILLGVLVGLGKTPQESINQVQEWQNTGASKILKSSTGTGTSGGLGTSGSTGIGSGAGTGTSGGTNVGGGTGTSGGMGTGGIGGTGFGSGTGTSGGTSSGGGTGTSGGMGTGGIGGTGFGSGTGTSGGTGRFDGMWAGTVTRGNKNKSNRLNLD